MLSICIPVFNVNVSNLVEVLFLQANGLKIPVEIILIDDHSSTDCVNENRKLKSSNLTYIELQENVGRARIRNMFVLQAKYDYLLFLDCDSQVTSSGFIRDYMLQIQNKEKVVCGGRIYSVERPEKNKLLHWKYGRNKESKPASQRMLNPYRSFMTNNFLIEKRVLESIRFDERLSGYGHEDTLFGYRLKKQTVPIKHINNPVLHAELQSNEEFLEKSENAIANLKKILEFVENDPAFIEDVQLLSYYMSLKKKGLLFLVKVPYSISKGILRTLLKKGRAGMALFDFYKLGYLVTN